ncbi:MAG: OmpP1/FadL family transporter [Omnitrophica WOR_2 bacterium]
MKRNLSLILCFLIGTLSLSAQNEIDALRYSRLSPSGTARYMALGGAFSALGADFTTLSHNPAGIGLYKSSEVSITPSLFVGRSEASYFGTVNQDERFNFNLGNAGIIFVKDPTIKNPNSDWKNIQFGFGINRLANFNNRVVISGFNETSSYLTPYVNDANNRHLTLSQLDNYGSGLAYDTYLMGYDSTTSQYFIDMPNGGVQQRKSIESSGSINEMVFSVGANYNDKVYLGATLGLPYINYQETAIYSERDTKNTNNYFNSFSRTDNLKTTGTGVNVKFGIIVRPVNWLRIGGAVETPTFYSDMADTYSTTFKASFDTLYGDKRSSADGYYTYKLNTPFRASAGVGLIVGKAGLVSVDYEYLDYAKARLRANDYDFENENNAIQNDFTKAHNLRFGTEWRYGVMSFRGGYSISANPYVTGTNSAMSSYSAGIGLRGQKFYADLTGVFSGMDDEYHIYNAPSGADPAISAVKVNTTMFLLTLGFRY